MIPGLARDKGSSTKSRETIPASFYRAGPRDGLRFRGPLEKRIKRDKKDKKERIITEQPRHRCQPHTQERSQLETPRWGNKTIIRDKQGLGWESGKPQWQIGVEIRAEQGCKEELTPPRGCSQSPAKTMRWQTTLGATEAILNLVRKKSPSDIPLDLSLLNFWVKLRGKDSAKSLITDVQPAAFFISSAPSTGEKINGFELGLNCR